MQKGPLVVTMMGDEGSAKAGTVIAIWYSSQPRPATSWRRPVGVIVALMLLLVIFPMEA